LSFHDLKSQGVWL